MKKKVIETIRFCGLWIILTIASAVASQLSGIGNFVKLDPEQTSRAALLSLIVTFAYTFVAVLITKNSAWRGYKLCLTLFLAFFGINGFLAQIESFVFMKQLVNILPPGIIPHIIINSALFALALSVLTPLFYGKFSGSSEKNSLNTWLQMPLSQWITRISIIGVAYIVIYLAFGFFVARPIAGDVFDQFYAGLKLPAWILPFQFARGILWAMIAIPVLYLLKKPVWNSGMILSSMYAVFIGIIMIVPNPLFPDRMRIGHLVELLSSSIVLGLSVVFILTAGRKVKQQGIA